MFPVSESKRSAASQLWCVRGQSLTPLASFEHKWSCHCTFRQVALSPWKQTDYLLYNSFSENTAILRRPSYVHEASDRFHLKGCFSPPSTSPQYSPSSFSFFRDASHSSPALFRSKMFPRRDMDSWRVPWALCAITSLCSFWDDSPHLHYRLLYNTIKQRQRLGGGGGGSSRQCSLTTH